MDIDVYTVSLHNTRKAILFEIPVVDITVKSGILAFAPTWDMVWGSKSGTMSDDTYTRLYTKAMIESKNKYPNEWKRLLITPKLALGCYCTPGKFCHRHILKDMLIDMHNELGNNVIDAGELS